MHHRVTSFAVALLAGLMPRVSVGQSPIARGSWLVAGTAQLTSFRDIGNDRRTTVVEVAPRVGLFLARGLALNANLRASLGSGDGGTNQAWGAGPGATYYVRATSHLYPFISARTLFTWGHSRSPGRQSTYDDWSSSWLVSTGAVAMMVTHVGLSAEAFYQHDTFSYDAGYGVGSNQAEQFGLRFGIAAFVF